MEITNESNDFLEKRQLTSLTSSKIIFNVLTIFLPTRKMKVSRTIYQYLPLNYLSYQESRLVILRYLKRV